MQLDTKVLGKLEATEQRTFIAAAEQFPSLGIPYVHTMDERDSVALILGRSAYQDKDGERVLHRSEAHRVLKEAGFPGFFEGDEYKNF